MPRSKGRRRWRTMSFPISRRDSRSPRRGMRHNTAACSVPRGEEMKTVCAGAGLALVLGTLPAMAQNVKITPLGSHAGELCASDRATIFEDPTGVRILYDV